MNFLENQIFFEMLITWITVALARNGSHCPTSHGQPHTPMKFHDSFDINKKTAAIFVKKLTIFLGDPPLGKYFLYFFPDHLEGRGFHQSMAS
jgi:hypothetical protein